MNEIEEIKQRLDLSEIVGQYVNLKKAGANYKGVCPFHHEKTPSLMVSSEKQIWKCFGCGKGGDVFRFIMEAEALEFGDALKMLADRAGVVLERHTSAEHQTKNRKSALYNINNFVSRAFEKILWEHKSGVEVMKYVRDRGLNDETIKQFRLGFASPIIPLKPVLIKKGFFAGDIDKAGSPERFRGRLVFPLFDVLGNVVGFTGRIMGSGEPKYLNSPETPIFSKGRFLYGLNFAKVSIKDKDRVILVEGQMDVISLHQAKFTETIATSGTAVTEDHLRLISKYTSNIFLAMDADSAGINATKKIIELMIKLDLNGRVVVFEGAKDASELIQQDPEKFKLALKGAKEMIGWLTEQTIAEVGGIRFDENKRKVLKLILPYIAPVGDAVRRDMFLQKITGYLPSVRPEAVYEAFGRINTSSTAGARGIVATMTGEEQMIALLAISPLVVKKYQSEIDGVDWQSVNTVRIAENFKKWYNTTSKDRVGDIALLKEGLSDEVSGLLDGWMLKTKEQWPDLDDKVAEELVKEKFSALRHKKSELEKINIAKDIKKAEEAGDLDQVKKLLLKLSDITKR